MNELKRYSMRITDMGIRAEKDEYGRWCRYEDVKKILSQLTKNNSRPMTNEEYAAALAKLQNEAKGNKVRAKQDAHTIKSLRQACVRLRNKLNKSETIRMKERALRPRVQPCLTFADIVKREG